MAVLWFLGFAALLVATLVASARGRAAPTEVVSRRIIGIAGIAYLGIAMAAVWTWGGEPATEGRATQLHDGALVHLAIDGVRISLGGPVVIGHDRGATIRVPGDADGAQGEVARIEPGPQGVIVRGRVLAAVHGDGAASGAARGCAASDAAFA